MQALTEPSRIYKCDFGSKFQLLQSIVIYRIGKYVNLNQNEKVWRINHYDKAVLNTFIVDGCLGTHLL